MITLPFTYCNLALLLQTCAEETENIEREFYSFGRLEEPLMSLLFGDSNHWVTVSGTSPWDKHPTEIMHEFRFYSSLA